MDSLSILGDLRHFASNLLLAVGALLPIVDPLGGAPIYLAVTADLTPEQRARLAKRVAINSLILLVASALIGAYVLDFFGLSIPAVQVAGGIVICAIAWSLLNQPVASDPKVRHGMPAPSPEDLGPRAFYPLTMPLTVGPGSISVALTLGANPPRGLRPLLVTSLAHGLGFLLVAASVYVCYRYAEPILTKLGTTGTTVLVRLSAFILLCIGVQIVWNGLHALLIGAFPGAS
jgi:multiple antibiotic resistance protein